MKAASRSAPVVAASLTAVLVMTIPFAPPTAVVFAVPAVFWAIASRNLKPSWHDVTHPIRMMHLSCGALLISGFVLLASVELAGVPATLVIQGVLLSAGPLTFFAAYSLLRVARYGRDRFRQEDILDTAVHVVLPMSVVASAAWPVFSSPTVSFDDRLTILTVGVLAAFIFAAGVLIIIATPPAVQSLKFLALAAISLGLLTWLFLLLWLQSSGLTGLYSRFLMVPALAYLVSVERGELLLMISGRPDGNRSRISLAVDDRHSRWVTYAAIGLVTVFVAALARSTISVVFAAMVGGLAVLRLALQSGQLTTSNQTIRLFDSLMSELEVDADPQTVVDQVTEVATALLGLDTQVQVVGLTTSQSTAEVDRPNAVFSRSGRVQVRTANLVPPEQMRAVRYLANLTDIALPGSTETDQASQGHSHDPDPGDRRRTNAQDDATVTGEHSSAGDVRLIVEDGKVQASYGPAIKQLGYDPVDSEAQPLLDAAASGELLPHGFAPGRLVRLEAYPTGRTGSYVITASDPAEVVDGHRLDRHSGLPNLLDFELQGDLEDVVVSVLYMHDLDRLRDSVGVDAGESFVRRLVGRVHRSFRENRDRVWRGDGSKLIILSPIESRSTPGTADRESLIGINHQAWIEARRASLSTPTALGMSFIAPTISAGFVVVEKAMPATEALQQAEMALMFARDNEPRSTVEYTTELHAHVSREWQLESYLAANLDDLGAGGFSVHYQPIIETASGLVKVVEALCRWNHPEVGPVSPAEFIPIAERTGMITEIDDFVLRQAIDSVGSFRAVEPSMVVQVNVSASGLTTERLAKSAKTIMHHLGGDNPGIAIEITESALTSQPVGELVEVLTFLREGGIGISLDDFGTGESNFERLRHLPFTQVKLANDFVRSDDSVLVSNVVNLVHGLRMECVIEGVETETHREIAVASGGDLLQGWVFAPALPAEQAIEFSAARRTSVAPSDPESELGSAASAAIESGLDDDGQSILLGSSGLAAENNNDQAGG